MTDRDAPSTRTARPHATLLRLAIVAALAVDAVLMWRDSAITYDGLNVAWIYFSFGFALPALALSCVPCFVLAPKLRDSDPATRRHALLHSAWPMLLALLMGTAIGFGDWEKMWFVVTPLVPPLVGLAAVASKTRTFHASASAH